MLILWASVGRADIILDAFDSPRLYPACCGEYGTYDGFFNSVTQDGKGTLVINASQIEGGGLYHHRPDSNSWNFSGQTSLVVRARALTNNTTAKFGINFQDSLDDSAKDNVRSPKRLYFEIPFSSLNTTSFTTITKSLIDPDFYDDGFDAARVRSMDILAAYDDESKPTFGLEFDFIKTVGPSNTAVRNLCFARADMGDASKWPNHVRFGLVELELAESLEAVISPDGYVPQRLAQFRAATNFGVRYALLREMAFIGGERAFHEFKHSLLRSNRTEVSSIEWAEIISTVEHMGFLATESDAAKDFLVQGTDPQFWGTNFTWTTGVGDRQLAGRCLSALALSGREEFFAAGERIHKRAIFNPLAPGVDLSDAMFMRDLLITKGIEHIKSILGTHTLGEEWKQWIRSSSQIDWSVWAAKHKQEAKTAR